MKKLTLREVQLIELDLLKQFAIYCDEHNLRYTLGYGTLLGAIRHKGFIPWDDDIDVVMPRPDYLAFQKLQKENPTFVSRSVTDKSSSMPFIKIMNLDVPICPYTITKMPEVCYVWIDVFPLDGYPTGENRAKAVHNQRMFLEHALFCAAAIIGEGTTTLKKFGKIPFCLLAKLFGRFRFAKLIEKLGQKCDFDQSEYIWNVVWGCGLKERMLKNEYLQRVKVQFEGNEFWAPGCWDSHLRNLYGDYMKLPPENQRKTHEVEAVVKPDSAF